MNCNPARQRGFGKARGAALAILLLLPGAGQADDWKVVAAKSWLGFRGAAQGASIEGRFTRWDARITFDPAQAELGHVVVTVDTASAVTEMEGRPGAAASRLV